MSIVRQYYCSMIDNNESKKTVISLLCSMYTFENFIFKSIVSFYSAWKNGNAQSLQIYANNYSPKSSSSKLLFRNHDFATFNKKKTCFMQLSCLEHVCLPANNAIGKAYLLHRKRYWHWRIQNFSYVVPVLMASSVFCVMKYRSVPFLALLATILDIGYCQFMPCQYTLRFYPNRRFYIFW